MSNQSDLNSPMLNMDQETLQNFLMFQNFMKMQNMMTKKDANDPIINQNNINQNTYNQAENLGAISNSSSNKMTKHEIIKNESIQNNISYENIVKNKPQSLDKFSEVNEIKSKVKNFEVIKQNEIDEKYSEKPSNLKKNSLKLHKSKNNDLDDKYFDNTVDQSNYIENKSKNNKFPLANYDENKEDSHLSPNNMSNNSNLINNKEENNNKNLFDEMPIKSGNKNFLELLEQNLQVEGNYNENNDNNTRKKIIKHERFKKVIKVSTPDEKEAKKYKYYSQNFDKNFGKDGNVDAPIDMMPINIPSKTEKHNKYLNEKTKSKSVSKFVPKGKKPIAYEIQLDNKKDNNASKEKSAVNNIIPNNKPIIKKKKEPSKVIPQSRIINKNENINLWGENNQGGDDDYDDFLDLEKESKQINKNVPITTPNNKLNANLLNNDKTKSPVPIQSKLKDSLNFNNKNIPDQKFNVGFNFPKEETTHDTKIELKPAQINQVKSKTLNQIINNNSNYISNQAKNPVYEQKLNNEINKINMYNHGIDIKEIEQFKEEEDESDNKEESNDSNRKHDDNNEDKSNKSVESDDRNIKEIFKNDEKINNKIEAKTTLKEKDNFFQENEDKIKYNQTELTYPSSNNVSVKTSIIKKNFNMNEGKKTVMAENKNEIENKDNYTSVANEKLKELNNEIVKLKIENEKVSKIKNEYEKLTILLQEENKEFSDKKDRENRDFENYKEDERNKILKEKKLFDKNLKAMQVQQNAPNRKEREEIESLKQQIIKLTEDTKKKETTNKLAIDRLRKQLDESNNKMAELSKELKNLEEMRLKNMGNISF